MGLEVNDCEHRERDRSAPRVMEVVLLKWGPLSFLGLNDGRWVSVLRFRASWGPTAVRGDSPTVVRPPEVGVWMVVGSLFFDQQTIT